MRRVRGYGLGLALIFGLSLGTLPLGGDEAAAQLIDIGITGEECGINLLAVCSILENETGDGGDADANGGDGGHGGRGGNGGVASVSNVANASAVSGAWVPGWVWTE